MAFKSGVVTTSSRENIQWTQLNLYFVKLPHKFVLEACRETRGDRKRSHGLGNRAVFTTTNMCYAMPLPIYGVVLKGRANMSRIVSLVSCHKHTGSTIITWTVARALTTIMRANRIGRIQLTVYNTCDLCIRVSLFMLTVNTLSTFITALKQDVVLVNFRFCRCQYGCRR